MKEKYQTILADPPWRFNNSTGKVSPEHKRLHRYQTMAIDEIASMAVASICDDNAHLYLWVPNALLAEGLQVMAAWGFTYKTNIVWVKITQGGEVSRGGVGFYFRNATELLLFGVRGSLVTLDSARTQPNVIWAARGRHSEKPQESYRIIEACSPGPRLELFARPDTPMFPKRPGWHVWGNEVESDIQLEVA
ncbi:MT-A70 family protein [Desulfatibacillum aliphaticivorans]|uniref:MT-A70 family protein n=1 Tax=Desulfatibacillum aliphaticivorans TaxID=218208 RepID=B8FCP3_DESAL|nr:MT-A70 family methyltransferase [Desulfatibacillum aliphaticivorans]ACL06206.1 MT-A70 family protein [Desulfatibacillum aliphaticivorans]